MATFATLYGTELDRELGTADRTVLFTTERRQAAINAGQQEFQEQTECLTRQRSITLVDETQEYDLEAEFTDFGGLSKQGVSVAIVHGSTTRYLEGDALPVTTVDRLNTEEPGWRAHSSGSPQRVYLRRDGGTVRLGFHPKPNISGETWTALVSYVAIPADMSADGDIPFTISANAIASLAPYHRALVHYAAYDLEKLRKDPERSRVQFELFMSYVERYKAKAQPKGGQVVRFVRNYRGRSPRVEDPRVWP